MEMVQLNESTSKWGQLNNCSIRCWAIMNVIHETDYPSQHNNFIDRRLMIIQGYSSG